MTMTLQAQRYDREPLIAVGEPLTVQHEGGPVELVVSDVQPQRDRGRWVNGHVGSRPAVVWVTW